MNGQSESNRLGSNDDSIASSPNHPDSADGICTPDSGPIPFSQVASQLFSHGDIPLTSMERVAVQGLLFREESLGKEMEGIKKAYALVLNEVCFRVGIPVQELGKTVSIDFNSFSIKQIK